MWGADKEAHCSSTCLEEEVAPTEVVVVFSGSHMRSFGKTD